MLAQNNVPSVIFRALQFPPTQFCETLPKMHILQQRCVIIIITPLAVIAGVSDQAAVEASAAAQDSEVSPCTKAECDLWRTPV